MGLYTKIDNQLDNYYEIVSINKRITKRNFYLKSLIKRYFKSLITYSFSNQVIF